MCGFAGVIAFEDRFRADRELLARMAARVAHRGPDGEALWINHEQEITPGRPQAALAFRRLAILDLDPRAMQPMTDGIRWIVFNGEIYNYRELRQEIDSILPGYSWKTTGDTEVILRAYDLWGGDCVNKLNGMFAFAIWDPAAENLFLARDRMGQKPLYYARAAGSASGAGAGSQPCGAVAFASELPALRELPWLDKRVYGLGLRCYLEWGMLPMGMTIYWGADKLPPATTTTFSAEGQGEPKRYFDVNAITPQVRDATETRRLVTEAVRRQLVADVPLGCFLSGGIDSSVIAAAMKASVPPDQPVMTFSIGFDDPNYDETAYAQAVAEHLGTVHRQFTVRPDAAEDLPKLAAAFGEPFADSSALPTHYLARETRRHVTVALSGDGGDELFGGYDRYRAMRLGLAGRFAPRLLLSLLARLPGTHPKGKSARLKRFAHSLKLNPADRYASYLRLFSEQQTAALVPASGARVLRAETQDLAAALFEKLSAGRDVVQTALAVDRMLYLPDDPLVKVDRASMLHGLEVRSPMLDPDVIAFAAGLSTAQLMDGGPKRMLREAFGGDLPRWVFSRQKMGFAVPIGDWLRTSLKSMVHDLLLAADAFSSGYFDRRNIETLIHEHETFRADHSQRIYALLMLELWWKSAK